MKFLKKTALFLLGLLLTILLIIGTVLWWVIGHPEETWAFAQRHFLPADLKVSWQEIHFKPKKITWLNWDIDFSLKGLLVEKAEPRIVAPVDELAIVFSISLFKPKTHADFANVLVHATKPIVFQPSPPDPNEPVMNLSIYERAKQAIGYLETGNSYISMRNLDVDVGEFKLLSINPEGDPLVASFTVTKSEDWEAPSTMQLDLEMHSGQIKRADFLGLVNLNRMGSADPFAYGELNFDGFKVEGKSEMSFIYNDDKVLRGRVTGPWHYQLGKNRLAFAPELTIKLEEGAGELRLVTSVGNLPEPLLKLDRVDASLNMPFTNGAEWSDQAATYRVAGPVDLFFIDRNMRAPLEKSCECKIPEKLLVGLAGKFWMRPLTAKKPSANRQHVAETRLTIEGVKNKLLSVDIAANLDIFLREGKWEYLPKIDSEVHILSYRGLRNFLDARNVMVPSPFDVLDGTIDITSKADVVAQNGFNRIPVVTKFQLSSANQLIKVEADTDVDIDSAFKTVNVYLRFLIDQFQVQLPPMDPIAGMPKVVRDSRIQLQPPPDPKAVAKAPSRVKVNVFFEAKTLTPGGIRLLSRFAKPYVPISIDVHRGADGVLSGSVQLEPFQIQYLRRIVKVEQLRMILDVRDSGDFPVDGRFTVAQTQYKVFIDVSGTLRNPLLRFSSEPYLDKADIISVLLYDHTNSELGSSEGETAGSFQSAIADRAIGLFGLWAFASTPIRSFTYNSVTKMYSATVQLADGVTAEVGTNWEEAAHLEVRKRVSKRWVLTASWQPSAADYDQAPRLTLQWEKRF